MLCTAFLLSALCLTAAAGSPQGSNKDREAVVAVVQRLFEAMGSNDAPAMRKILLPDGQFHSVREEQGGKVVRRSSFADLITKAEEGKDRMVERMWNPEVRIEGDVATLTAPYDFHLNGSFSHCGIDSHARADGRGVAPRRRHLHGAEDGMQAAPPVEA